MVWNRIGNLAALFLAFVFVACGGDSGSNGKTETDESSQAETFDELPNCSKNREGETVAVIDDRKTYICSNGRWEYLSEVPDTVKTEDDLSACLEKNEGKMAFVTKDSTVWGCFDKRWEEFGTAYQSADDLPNCSDKREGNTAYVVDDKESLMCSDGKWGKSNRQPQKQESDSMAELKTSSSNKQLSSSSVEKNTNESSSSESKETLPESSSSSVEEIIMGLKLPMYQSMTEFPKCVFEDLGKIIVSLSDTSYFICEKEGSNGISDYTMKYREIRKEEMKLVFDAAFGECSEKNKNQEFNLFGKVIICEENTDFHYFSYHYHNVFDLFTDARDGQEYKMIKIGDQIWMAENLKYDYKIDGTEFSYCFENNSDNCEKYGRIYTWAAAMDSAAVFSEDGKGCGAGPKIKINSVMKEGVLVNDTVWYCKPENVVRGICPLNWHLPSVKEYRQLVEFVSGESCKWNKSDPHACAGAFELKTWSGWSHSGNGSNEYGFSALPAGFSYKLLDSTAAFWETDFILDASYYRDAKAVTMDYSHNDVNFNDVIPAELKLSIRCIKD